MYENEFLVLMYLPCKSYKLKKENKIKKVILQLIKTHDSWENGKTGIKLSLYKQLLEQKYHF